MILQNPHAVSNEEIFSLLNVSPDQGLTSAEAEKRLRSEGENILKRKKPKSIFKIFIDQFLNPIIYLLVAAMVLAFIFSEVLEGFAVLVVILITAIIGFIMEWQAVRSVEALQKMVVTSTTVIREGGQHRVQSRFLVKGDIILIQAGDVVPADARLIEHQSLKVKEAMLTGESEEVQKVPGILTRETPVPERLNMVFNGTIIARGNAKAVVTNTGDETIIGQINYLTLKSEKKRTPLQKRLKSLSNWLILLTILFAIIIALSGFFTDHDPVLMIKTSIALAVAAIPEGLPVVATITLARGMLALAKRKVVIKDLEAVQTLGETNIICTDKTGTLTENKMVVEKIAMDGILLDANKIKEQSSFKESIPLIRLMEVAILCNTSNGGKSNGNADAIDIALIELAKNLELDLDRLYSDNPEVLEIPFDPKLKFMATVNGVEGSYKTLVKGAPESILNLCDSILIKDHTRDFKDKIKWEKKTNELATNGLRVIAFAYKMSTQLPKVESVTQQLTFLGLVGFVDPPRSDISEVIQVYKDAGIKVCMLTGDHPETARKIAKDIGLLDSRKPEETIILGSEYQKLLAKGAEGDKMIGSSRVFARMQPEQKLDLVDFYQAHNGVVGMLGDGINDTPALKKADIGIAMGIRGTEAAREVADMILLDDKFAAIKLAIHQGRVIFENIRYFVIFLLSCNLAEIISVGIATISNLPLPLLPLQILYLNLITDIFPALALGMGKGSQGIMKKSPRDPEEDILTRKHWLATVIYGVSITASVIAVVLYANLELNLSYDVVNNMAFYTLIGAQLLNVFNLPSGSKSFIWNEVTSNPWIWASIVLSVFITYLGYAIPLLRETLNLVSLTSNQLILILLFAGSSLIIPQLIKRTGWIRI